jgi:hypothetical protein
MFCIYNKIEYSINGYLCARLIGADVVKRHDEAIGSWCSEGALGPCPELGVVECPFTCDKMSETSAQYMACVPKLTRKHTHCTLSAVCGRSGLMASKLFYNCQRDQRNNQKRAPHSIQLLWRASQHICGNWAATTIRKQHIQRLCAANWIPIDPAPFFGFFLVACISACYRVPDKMLNVFF